MNQIHKPSLLIDASIYIFQYYFALPDHWFSEKESWPTAAVYGYTNFLIRLLKEQRPERAAVCFDESLESCFRNDIYTQYKSSRVLPDESLAFQLAACKKVTSLLGFTTFASKTHEADDLLGSLYQSLRRSKKPIAVLTRDKDLGQIILREQDFLWDYSAVNEDQGKKSSNTINPYIEKGIKYYPCDIEQKFGVRPQQLSDYLALVGDISDDIPGVPGVGKVTAKSLLGHFANIEAILSNVDEIGALSIRGGKGLIEKIIAHKEQIVMAKKLATIVTTLPLITAVDDLVLKKPSLIQYQKFCKEMGFPRLHNSIDFLLAKN